MAVLVIRKAYNRVHRKVMWNVFVINDGLIADKYPRVKTNSPSMGFRTWEAAMLHVAKIHHRWPGLFTRSNHK